MLSGQVENLSYGGAIRLRWQRMSRLSAPVSSPLKKAYTTLLGWHGRLVRPCFADVFAFTLAGKLPVPPFFNGLLAEGAQLAGFSGFVYGCQRPRFFAQEVDELGRRAVQ